MLLTWYFILSGTQAAVPHEHVAAGTMATAMAASFAFSSTTGKSETAKRPYIKLEEEEIQIFSTTDTDPQDLTYDPAESVTTESQLLL